MSYVGEELLWIVFLILLTLLGLEIFAYYFGSSKK